MYSGGALSADKIAVLVSGDKGCHGFFALRNVEVTRVDGKLAMPIMTVLLSQLFDEPPVHLLPGKHDIALKGTFLNSYACGNVWFVAEAGKHYTANMRVKGYSMYFWIEDDATGKPVGGIKGSDDEPHGGGTQTGK